MIIFDTTERRFRYGPLCGTRYKGGMWVRLWGYGFNCKNIRLHGLFFSERWRSKEKHLHVFGWTFKMLTPKDYRFSPKER